MASKARAVKVKSWDELPEVLEKGVYYVNGVKFVVSERVERDVMRTFIKTVKRIDRIYYQRR